MSEKRATETPVLRTKSLILRPVKLSDAAAIQKHFDNWNIIKNLNDQIPWPYPDDGAEDFLKNNALPRVQKGEAFIWSIVFESNLIGLIDMGWPNERNAYGDRGFWLAEPYWKKGFMTEAITAVNDYVFDVLKFEKYTVCNAHGNEGSRRVKEKTGAVLIGQKKINHHQGITDSDVWEVTAKNWRKFKEKNL